MPKKTNKTESIEAAIGQGKDEKRDRREIYERAVGRVDESDPR
jgi:hypothetical protein